MRLMILAVLMTATLMLAGCSGTATKNTQPAAPAPNVDVPKTEPVQTAPTAPVVARPTPEVKQEPVKETQKEVAAVDCNPLKDKTCTTLSVGQEAIIDNELKLKISNLKTQKCEPDYAAGETDNYIVFDVDAENVGDTGTIYFGSNVFYIIDSARTQRSGSLGYPMGIYKTEECKDARNGALETANIESGSRSSGKVWIELKKPLPTGESYVVYKKLFGNTNAYFRFNAN